VSDDPHNERSERPRGRPRRADANDSILTAATQLLRETGYRAFSVDIVAQRTGIAKTTIYRRWPDKASLALAVVEASVTESRTDLRGVLGEITNAMALIGAAEPDGVTLLFPFITRRLETIRDALDIPNRVAVADALVGSLLIRFADGRHATDHESIDEMLRTLGINT
jgi:AcrR family transcriptional regulator